MLDTLGVLVRHAPEPLNALNVERLRPSFPALRDAKERLAAVIWCWAG